MKKIIVIVMICLMSLVVFSACSLSEKDSSSENETASESDKSDSSDSTANQIGEAVTCVTEDGGKINITIKNYGSTVEGITQILYVDYEIENVGDQMVSVGNSMFCIYADDYTVEQSNLGEKAIILENVVPGKKVAARLYGNIDPKSVDKIELIVGNVTFAIKGEGVSEEALERRLLREDQVSYALADEELITDIAGIYEEMEDAWGSKVNRTVIVTLYSSPESNRLGNVEIKKSMFGDYAGEFVEIKTNVYQLVDQVDPVVISFKINALQQLCVHVYVRGIEVAAITRTRVYESQGNSDEEETYIKENPIVEDSEEVSDKDEIKETEEQGDLSEYILPDSSTKQLKVEDVKDLSRAQCRLAKNEIYARHGRLFQDGSLQKYFDKKSWYSGYIKPEDFDESVLSKIEKANVKLLAKYESKK